MKTDIGLLILRLGFGGMMLFGHGMGKLLGFSEKLGQFPDPIGLGSNVSLVLAVFAEAVCSVFVMMGLATRLACIPLIITMAVAVLFIHAQDPWMKKELALAYLIPFLTLMLTGAGRFSIDQLRGKR